MQGCAGGVEIIEWHAVKVSKILFVFILVYGASGGVVKLSIQLVQRT